MPCGCIRSSSCRCSILVSAFLIQLTFVPLSRLATFPVDTWFIFGYRIIAVNSSQHWLFVGSGYRRLHKSNNLNCCIKSYTSSPICSSLSTLAAMSLSNLVEEVKVAARAVSSGDPTGYSQLLRAIHGLNLAAETPTETLIRISLQVRNQISRSWFNC